MPELVKVVKISPCKTIKVNPNYMIAVAAGKCTTGMSSHYLEINGHGLCML